MLRIPPHGDLDTFGKPGEPGRFARFIPSGSSIDACGATDQEALTTLASEMRRIAEKIEEYRDRR
jgi:hypothetical protein